MIVGLAVLVALALRFQRGFSFVVDEWDILAHYYDGHYLSPYNGHLSLVPVAIYQTLASTVGIDSYRMYGAVGIAVFLAIPVAFFVSHRRHVDERLVAVAALGIAWSWAAQHNLMYGFLMNFDIPLLMLVVSWPLIRRATLRADLWAVAALSIALASSSVGVVVAFAIGVELILARTPLRRLVRFAPPVLAWALWWILRHEATKPASLAERASYAWHVAVAILAGFTLGWTPGAVIVALGHPRDRHARRVEVAHARRPRDRDRTLARLLRARRCLQPGRGHRARTLPMHPATCGWATC